jgi:hypothetical protein
MAGKTEMSITKHSNRTRVVEFLSIALLLLSACKHGRTDAATKEFMPGLGQPVRVSSEDVDAAEPVTAASPDGGVYVVWVNHGPKTQGDVMIARFSSDGHMQGPTVRVNPQAGMATAWRGDPPTVVIAPDQTVFVGWTARVEAESGHATDLYLSSSRDHGQTFGAPIKVNDDTKPAVHGMHSLAIGDDGWMSET